MRRCRCWSMVPPRRGRFVMMTASRCAGSATGRASASASDGHGSASGLGDVQRRNYMHCRSSQITEQGSGGGGTGSSGSSSVGTGRVGGRCWNLLRIIIFVRLLVGHAVWYLFFYVCTSESRYVLPLSVRSDGWFGKVQPGLLMPMPPLCLALLFAEMSWFPQSGPNGRNHHPEVRRGGNEELHLWPHLTSDFAIQQSDQNSCLFASSVEIDEFT